MTNAPDITLTWNIVRPDCTYDVCLSANGATYQWMTNTATNVLPLYFGNAVTQWSASVRPRSGWGPALFSNTLTCAQGRVNLKQWSNQVSLVYYGTGVVCSATNLQHPEWRTVTNWTSNRWNAVDVPMTNATEFFKVQQ